MSLAHLRIELYRRACERLPKRPLPPPSDKSMFNRRWTAEEDAALIEGLRLGETIEQRMARVTGRWRGAVSCRCAQLRRHREVVE